MTGRFSSSWIAKMGMLTAAVIVIQFVGFALPLPLPAAMFLVGTAFSVLLLCAIDTVSFAGALLLVILMPITALLHQAMTHPILLLPAMTANLVYVLAYTVLKRRPLWMTAVLVPAARVAGAYAGSTLLLRLFDFDEQIFAGLRSAYVLIQFLTGAVGVCIWYDIRRRLPTG